jgi:hypothetical protein
MDKTAILKNTIQNCKISCFIFDKAIYFHSFFSYSKMIINKIMIIFSYMINEQ